MLSYSDIENLTNEEAVLQFAYVTRTPIDCGLLDNWLDSTGLAARDPITGAWTGTLVDLIAAGDTLSAAVSRLLSHLNNPRNEFLLANEPEWGQFLGQLITGLKSSGAITEEQVDAWVALGAGRTYPQATESYFQALRDEEAARLAEAERIAAQKAEDEANAPKFPSFLSFEDVDGLTNEEVVAIYGHVTRAPIDCGELENWLDNQSLAQRDAITGSWAGMLIDVMQAGGLLGAGITKLFSHLNKPRSTQVETNLSEWAGLGGQLIGGLQQAGVITPDQAAAFYELGDGRLYNGINEQDVQEIRDIEAQRIADEEAAEAQRIADEEAAEAQRIADAEAQAIEDAARAEFFARLQRYNELFNIHISPLATAENTDDATWIDALQAMSDEFVVVE